MTEEKETEKMGERNGITVSELSGEVWMSKGKSWMAAGAHCYAKEGFIKYMQ